MSPFRLDGKAILITGATQGLGEDIARASAAAGAKGLCLTGRNEARGRQIANEIEASGTPVLFVAADLADAQATAAVAEAGLKRFGAFDGLVNAAGLTDRGTIEDTTAELWDRLFAVNARAPFILTQAVIRALQKAKRPGSIVNIITRSSHGGQPFLVPYSSSKGALATFTRNVAHSQRKHRIRVNGLNIGWTDTPGEHAIKKWEGQPANWLDIVEREQPFGRLIKPKDVTTLTLYLLSDASEMMTGSLIDFDQNVMGAYD
jgi:NAD(P)-dependent dehydrogenase (short-subunit alcohol dehydrogenase family)